MDKEAGFWGIELKTDKGILTESQKAMRERFKVTGHDRYLVARPKDYKEVLKGLT